MLDEDFFLAVQTHLTRVTRTCEQDNAFLNDLLQLATKDPSLMPLWTKYVSIVGNRLDSLVAVNEDLAKLMQFCVELVTLVSAAQAFIGQQQSDQPTTSQSLDNNTS